MSLATAFVEHLANDGVDPLWLAAHIDPVVLPGPPTAAALAQWQEALRPDTIVGGLLHSNPDIAAVTTGPNYTRVIYNTEPSLSVRIRREGDSLRIDALEVTACIGCDERERFVRDLVTEVQISGGTGRLLPGVELEVSRLLQQNAGSRDVHWVSAWTARRGGANLTMLLAGARVSGIDGDVVNVVMSDGYVDSWRILWRDGRWQLDYDSLPDNSPLRLSPAQASQRGGDPVEWTPSFRQEHGAVVLGTAVTGIAVDPLLDEIILVIGDADGRFHELVRLDPLTRELTARIALPDTDTPSIVQSSWFSSWRVASDLRARIVAASVPGSVLIIDTETGRLSSSSRSGVTALTVAGSGAFVADRRGRLWTPSGDVVTHDTALLAVAPDASTAIRKDGALVQALQPHAPVVATLCSGEATGAALSPDGGMWAVTCGATSDTVVAFVGADGSSPFSVRGQGGGLGALAWSPDGTRVAASVGSSGQVAIFDGSGDIVRTFGRDVRQIAWTGDGTALVTAHIDGTARLWMSAP